MQSITRVELHGATERHYEILHAEMGQLGFRRQIEGSDGHLYDLPTATYWVPDPSTSAPELLKLAKAAAARTGCKFVVLVVPTDLGIMWEGLGRRKVA